MIQNSCMEVREINRICWIESSSALSDKSKDQFKSGGEITFEHFVKPPVSFVIRFPKYLSLDSILIKASNVVIKINTTRRFLDKLDFGRKETILLHSAADTPNRQVCLYCYVYIIYYIIRMNRGLIFTSEWQLEIELKLIDLR